MAGRVTVVALSLGFMALLPFSGRAEKLRSVEARNITAGIYSDDSSTLIAVLKVAKVFNENRRLGFFRVKLLPILVAQGMRLDFTESKPNTNWVAGLRAGVCRGEYPCLCRVI